MVSWAGGGEGALGGSDEGAMKLRPYNQRIELPSVDDFSDGEGRGLGGGGGGGGSGDDDGIHDLDEDELTRDKVKKAASQVWWKAVGFNQVEWEVAYDRGALVNSCSLTPPWSFVGLGCV